jgi:hypothetical protein
MPLNELTKTIILVVLDKDRRLASPEEIQAAVRLRLRAYGQECAREMRERAAQVLEAHMTAAFTQSRSFDAAAILAAIRALPVE